MVYVIAFGGLAGTALLAYAIWGAELMFPRWKRWAIGIVGFALVAALWTIRPILTNAPPDGSSTADEWP